MHTGKEHSRGEQPAAHESGNAATGHPANNVISSTSTTSTNNAAAPHGNTAGTRGGDSMQRADVAPAVSGNTGYGHEAGTRGSGTPVESGAGKLADDRPGRDVPKGGGPV